MSQEQEGKWLLDPSGANEYRWHDGNDFTDHVSNGGQMGQAPLGKRDPNAPAVSGRSQGQDDFSNQIGNVMEDFKVSPDGFSSTGSIDSYTGGITGTLLGTGDADEMLSEVDVVHGRTLLVHCKGQAFRARKGSMVAYQGNVDFDYQSQGLGNMFKRALSGEGLSLMKVGGHGDVYLAHNSNKVHILKLDNASISINGKNVLAFQSSLNYNIEMIRGGAAGLAAGGLMNTVLSGSGWLAILTDGDPIVLDAGQAPTYADTNALVGWSTGLNTTLKSTFKVTNLIGRGSGEMFQAHFTGKGSVIVQPSEGFDYGLDN